MICFEWFEIVKIGLGIMNQFMDHEIPHTQLSGMFHLVSETHTHKFAHKTQNHPKKAISHYKLFCLIDSNGK